MSNTRPNKIYIDAISLVAPGLNGWQQSEKVLLGDVPYVAAALDKFSPSILPANERRRTTQLIKLALHAAETCANSNTHSAANYATVFATSDGDHAITNKICHALALPEHPVSPTQFHNSVHNAAAGYWAIAAKAELNSTSISAGDGTLAAGLLDAASFAVIEQQPVLFVAFDFPAPTPLDAARHLEACFAVALSITPEKGNNCIAEIELELKDKAAYSTCDDKGLEQLRTGNPAARALPLLQAIASKQAQDVVIPHVNNTALCIAVS